MHSTSRGFRRSEQGKISGGCIAGIVIAVVLGGLAVIALVGLGGFVYYRANAVPPSGAPGTPDAVPSSGPTGVSSTGGGTYEVPEPSAAESAAVAGGQTVTWSQQAMSWTLPQKWTKQNEEKMSLLWSSPGYGASLIVSVSPMSDGFPVDASLKATYDQAAQRMKNDEIVEVKRMKLDGVDGVEFREASPEKSDDIQRLQWIGFRTYLGQTQMVNVMLSTKKKDADQYTDALYGILYSTKIPHA